MHHVAILTPNLHFDGKILRGEKTIESRWYRTRRTPWGKVHAGDTVYFKNSGQPVTLCALVTEVRQYSLLTPGRILQLVQENAAELGVADVTSFYKRVSSVKFAIFIRLAEPRAVQPFSINKAGYGLQAAWLVATDIRELQKT